MGVPPPGGIAYKTIDFSSCVRFFNEARAHHTPVDCSRVLNPAKNTGMFRSLLMSLLLQSTYELEFESGVFFSCSLFRRKKAQKWQATNKALAKTRCEELQAKATAYASQEVPLLKASGHPQNCWDNC